MSKCLCSPVSRCCSDPSNFICGMVTSQGVQEPDGGQSLQDRRMAAEKEGELFGGRSITGPDYGSNVPRTVPGVARPLPEPKEPTPAERARHMLTHLPYCSWCPIAVRGADPTVITGGCEMNRACQPCTPTMGCSETPAAQSSHSLGC